MGIKIMDPSSDTDLHWVSNTKIYNIPFKNIFTEGWICWCWQARQPYCINTEYNSVRAGFLYLRWLQK